MKRRIRQIGVVLVKIRRAMSNLLWTFRQGGQSNLNN